MSTRVDKGGPKFKPNLKSKARPVTPASKDVLARHTFEPTATLPQQSIPQTIPIATSATSPLITPVSESPFVSRTDSNPRNAEATIIVPSSRRLSAVPLSTLNLAPTSTTGLNPTLSVLPPSPSKGTEYAASEETEEESSEDDHTKVDDARGGIARKRPKLSIVQEQEDGVENPSLVTTTVSKAEPTGVEHYPDGLQQNGTIREGSNLGEYNETETMDGDLHAKRQRSKRKQTQASVNADADAVQRDSEPPSEPAAPTKKRKKRQKTNIPEPDGTLEPIDPTQVTMSSICEDPGSGRVSSRWETSQTLYMESRKRAREERARAIVEAAEEERQTGRAGVRKGVPRPSLPSESEPTAAGAESTIENTGGDPEEFTYDESLKESHYAPQVRIGANGEVVLDLDSLQVDRAADPEIAEETYSFIEESDQSKFTNSNSWSKRRSVRWSKEDTAMFYEGLRQYGQNFDLLARILPGRTYQMCKNKFKAEDKRNPKLIDDALRNRAEVDLDTLSRMTGKDFSGPTPVIEAKKALDLGENDSNAHLIEST